MSGDSLDIYGDLTYSMLIHAHSTVFLSYEELTVSSKPARSLSYVGRDRISHNGYADYRTVKKQ